MGLEFACKGELEDGNILDLKVLIDTGAEINLIRRGMVPDRLLTRHEKVWIKNTDPVHCCRPRGFGGNTLLGLVGK